MKRILRRSMKRMGTSWKVGRIGQKKLGSDPIFGRPSAPRWWYHLIQ